MDRDDQWCCAIGRSLFGFGKKKKGRVGDGGSPIEGRGLVVVRRWAEGDRPYSAIFGIKMGCVAVRVPTTQFDRQQERNDRR